jgi:hypothetical protein
VKTRIYLQSEFLPDVKLVEVNAGASARSLKDACLAVLPEEARQHELYLFEEDAEAEIIGHDIEKLNREHGVRLHLHRCKHVRVTVRYADRAVEKDFPPSATIGRIKKWAAQQIGMTPEDAAEHVLQFSGASEQPDADLHVGSFAKCPECSVSFDLVPCHRING